MTERLKNTIRWITAPLRALSKKNRILLAVLAVAALAIPLISATAPEPKVVESEESTWSVTTMPADPGSRSPEIALFGRVETPRSAFLTSAVSARVSLVHVLEGETVERGELLIRLDDQDARLEVARRQADLDDAESSLASLRLQHADNVQIFEHERKLYRLCEKKVARHRELRSTQAISEEILNGVLRESHQQAISLKRNEGLVADFANLLRRAGARLERAESNLDGASLQLARTRIRAPFNGRVTSVDVAPGERVNMGMNLLEIYDSDALEVRAQIPSALLVGLTDGATEARHRDLRAEIHIDDQVVPARLTRLSGVVKTGNSGVDGFFSVTDRFDQLPLGRVVSLTLNLPSEPDVVQVPLQSIYGENRVFIVSEGRLQGVTVNRLGASRKDGGDYQVLIRAPELARGTPIVTTQLANAISGMKVSINNELPAIAAENFRRRDPQG